MNKNFKNNIINTYGGKGKQWLADLPNIIKDMALEWNLSNLKPVDNLSMNYVASGLQGSEKVVLKLSLNEDLIRKEYIALKALVGFGAVEVIAYKEKTLLLKKLNPGVSLKTYLVDRRTEALKIACEVTKRLHQAPLPKNIELTTIEEKFSLLDKDWPISQDYLVFARKFRDEIFLKYRERKILHGDLHHDNILQDGNNWKIIDPHGVIGFPINEIWAFICDVDEDIPFISNYFAFDIEDIKKCYFMHAVLSAIWSVEDNVDPTRWLNLANIIRLRF